MSKLNAPPNRRRSGGRAARVAARLNGDENAPNPAPTGPKGGQYRPLTDRDCDTIYDAAVTLLGRVGIGDVPEIIKQRADARGCNFSDDGRVLYSREFIEDIIEKTPKSMVLHGQNPEHDFEVSDKHVHFGTGGAAVQVLGLNTGEYRAACLQDVYDFARLAHNMENISWFTRCCIATDVEDIYDLDINTAYAIATGTSKHIGTSFSFGSHVHDVVKMFDMMLGRSGAFKERPFCKAHISPVISPLRYGEDAVDVAQACVQHNMPINAIIAAQAGATAPAPLAGMLAQSLAETLAALVMIDLLKPGYPVIFSNWPFVVDLRTGAFSGGGAESAILNAASAQLTNRLRLMSGVAASMSDAKIPDAQAGFEKGMTTLATGLAGGNLVYESAGMFASLLGASFEGFVIDNEILGTVQRIIRGVEVNSDTLNLDVIENAVRGAGHFLGGDNTLDAMQRDYYYPALSDRNTPEGWAETGALDMRAQAREKAKMMLSSSFPDHIDEKTDARIRAEFKIHLKRENMQH